MNTDLHRKEEELSGSHEARKQTNVLDSLLLPWIPGFQIQNRLDWRARYAKNASPLRLGNETEQKRR
jgi:hypothetical protein